MKPKSKIGTVLPMLGVPVFAGAWYFGDIYIATAALMMMFTLHIALLFALRQPIDKSAWLSWVLIILFGGLTLLLREKIYVQFKTTVVYSIFALALLVSDYAFGKNLPKLALAAMFDAPDSAYRRISSLLALYFFALALANWFVLSHYEESVWVAVKTFGFPVMTLCVVTALLATIFRYLRQDAVDEQ